MQRRSIITRSPRSYLSALAIAQIAVATACAQDSTTDAEWVRSHYTKYEHRISMRDGVRLFTAVYVPNDVSRTHPIILFRTPYSCRPYGADRYRESLGPTMRLARDGCIFAYQDVRGRLLSEGRFVNMTPHRATKTSPRDTDESTDTWDTVEWLVENIAGNNGRVGQWGISYPGFYSAAGMIDTHPALVAVSPQAPLVDWFWDDFHHHGAFFLPHAFNFISRFGRPRPEPTTESPPPFDHGTPDGYRFFLDVGKLSEVNERWFDGEVAFWDDLVAHPNYDEYWQSRNLLPHLRNIRCAVMTVGGWFDAEDLYGPLKTYRTVEDNNPGIENILVMGPWDHGAWERRGGDALGSIAFGFKTAEFYEEQILYPFFKRHLFQRHGAGDENDALELPEAFVFETGANRWRRFDAWPPRGTEKRSLYCRARGGLAFEAPDDASGDGGPAFDEYISDPRKPVPFSEEITRGMTREYMTDDQRFAERRPDVVTYRTEVLDGDLTLAGPIRAELWVSTSGTASDWIVKLIDVFPESTPDSVAAREGVRMGGYQMMVRSEVIRGRFRNSYEHPEPFVPNEPARVAFELQDLLHTFQRGHRIMVQIQSTWFPLVDRNPQKYIANMFEASDEDYTIATQRVFRSPGRATRLELGVLSASAPVQDTSRE